MPAVTRFTLGIMCSCLRSKSALIASIVVFISAITTHAQRPLGTDVSHYQGAGINWVNVKNAGVTFAWAKATESTNFTDANFAGNQANAKAAGVYIGAYHFARPSDNPNITGANSAETEAQFFWSVASNYIKGGGFHMMPMLDWEDSGATVAAGFTVTQMSSWVNQWCNSVSNYAYASGVTNVRPVVYTGVWFSSPNATYPGLNSSVTQWAGWIAAYPANPNPQTGGPSSTFPWPTWTFWQYADTNWSGGDSDVFNGTISGLGNYVIGGISVPGILSQPSSRYADRGSAITLRATASGGLPLKYQWRFNGANIANATNTTLALSNIQSSNAGNYTLVVTNSSGSVTSSVAALTVNPLFTPVFSDNFDVNSSANWTVNSSPANNRSTFAYDYSDIGIPSAPNSTGGTTKGLRFEANLNSSAAAALSASPVGQSFSGNYRLHFDMWINVNGPLPGGGTGSTEAITAGVGTAGSRVQWTGSGTTADGVWFTVDGEGGVANTSPTQGDFVAYIGTAGQATNSGVYSAGFTSTSRDNTDVYYANVFPSGQTPPIFQISNYVQQTGSLNVGAVGFVWRDVVINKSGSTVEWFIDGLKIATVSSASITASNIFVGYWDPFTSISDNTNLSFGLVDNVRVEVPAVAPTLSIQPLAIAVKVTSNAAFNVTAAGIPAPTYQWRFNGTNIAAATLASYTRSNVQYSQVGNYSVSVSNIAGTIVSSNALLTILPAAPGEFQTTAVQPDGSMLVTLGGDAGATYFVETSTNLVNWSALTNVSLAGPTIQFNVGTTTNDPQRYFRARSAP